jgi:hypothetical protein
MKVSAPNLYKVYERTAVEELANRLESDGYRVELDPKIGNVRPDLMASKGDDVVFYEVKLIGSQTYGDSLSALRQSIKSSYPNARFHLISLTPPDATNIELDGIEQSLIDFLSSNPLPPSLDELSSNTQIDQVSSIEISRLKYSEKQIQVSGSGLVHVVLQFGPEGNDGVESTDYFPFSFSAILDHDLEIQTADFSVDTSSFWE